MNAESLRKYRELAPGVQWLVRATLVVGLPVVVVVTFTVELCHEIKTSFGYAWNAAAEEIEQFRRDWRQIR